MLSLGDEARLSINKLERLFGISMSCTSVDVSLKIPVKVESLCDGCDFFIILLGSND
jgi:hypothetical protein